MLNIYNQKPRIEESKAEGNNLVKSHHVLLSSQTWTDFQIQNLLGEDMAYFLEQRTLYHCDKYFLKRFPSSPPPKGSTAI